MATFTTKRRVEFAHTDMAGVVHFSEYAQYLESAEHEFLRSHGLSVSTVQDGRYISWPRVSCGFDFFLPLRFEDELSIELGVERIGEKSVTYVTGFHLDGKLCAKGTCTAVCSEMLGKEIHPIAIPDRFRSALTSILVVGGEVS